MQNLLLNLIQVIYNRCPAVIYNAGIQLPLSPWDRVNTFIVNPLNWVLEPIHNQVNPYARQFGAAGTIIFALFLINPFLGIGVMIGITLLSKIQYFSYLDYLRTKWIYYIACIVLFAYSVYIAYVGRFHRELPLGYECLVNSNKANMAQQHIEGMLNQIESNKNHILQPLETNVDNQLIHIAEQIVVNAEQKHNQIQLEENKTEDRVALLDNRQNVIAVKYPNQVLSTQETRLANPKTLEIIMTSDQITQLQKYRLIHTINRYIYNQFIRRYHDNQILNLMLQNQRIQDAALQLNNDINNKEIPIEKREQILSEANVRQPLAITLDTEEIDTGIIEQNTQYINQIIQQDIQDNIQPEHAEIINNNIDIIAPIIKLDGIVDNTGQIDKDLFDTALDDLFQSNHITNSQTQNTYKQAISQEIISNVYLDIVEEEENKVKQYLAKKEQIKKHNAQLKQYNQNKQEIINKNPDKANNLMTHGLAFMAIDQAEKYLPDMKVNVPFTGQLFQKQSIMKGYNQPQPALPNMVPEMIEKTKITWNETYNTTFTGVENGQAYWHWKNKLDKIQQENPNCIVETKQLTNGWFSNDYQVILKEKTTETFKEATGKMVQQGTIPQPDKIIPDQIINTPDPIQINLTPTATLLSKVMIGYQIYNNLSRYSLFAHNIAASSLANMISKTDPHLTPEQRQEQLNQVTGINALRTIKQHGISIFWNPLQSLNNDNLNNDNLNNDNLNNDNLNNDNLNNDNDIMMRTDSLESISSTKISELLEQESESATETIQKFQTALKWCKGKPTKILHTINKGIDISKYNEQVKTMIKRRLKELPELKEYKHNKINYIE